MLRWLTFVVLLSLTIGTSYADSVRITEFMSEGQGDTLGGNGGRRQREFFEVTNLGHDAVDTFNWSYNDNNTNDPINWGSAVGSIAAGESIVFTQMTAPDSAVTESAASVRVFSYLQLSNLGNADTINIYNSETQNALTLVDTLIYTADARGSGVSRNRPYDGGTGQADNSAWVISTVGDSFQSRLAPSPTGFPPNFPTPTTGFNQADYIDLANPGVYVPEPSTWAMALIATAMLALRIRRSK